MADFDRARFTRLLTTRRLGRSLIVHDQTASTNDDAWEAARAGAPDGTTVIAGHQTAGRGRAGRVWHDTPGRGLALSVLMDSGPDSAPLGISPLVAGLALARALDGLGARADLKWPNDLLLHGRKLAGILCEGRRRSDGRDAVVVGVGVNVSQALEDFPPELRDTATSLAVEDHDVAREEIAAAFLDALEPLWDARGEAASRAALDAWRERARFWGERVTARTPAGEVSGIAEGLADDGALIVREPGGRAVRIVAGDLAIETAAGSP